MRVFNFVFLVMLLIGLSSAVSIAEDSKDVVKETPITKWRAAEDAMAEKLDDEVREMYFILRNKQSTIRAIRVVKRDVAQAVQECGQRNPDIQDRMSQRFTEWKHAVDPLLKTADAYLKQEIKEQDKIKRSVFKKMEKLNDEAFDYKESLVDKKYVTTKDACEKLLSSMDNTEEDMLRLMQEILLPTSVIRERG